MSPFVNHHPTMAALHVTGFMKTTIWGPCAGIIYIYSGKRKGHPIQRSPKSKGTSVNEGSDDGDGSHGDGNHLEILEKMGLDISYISMFLMVWGGLYGLKSCPGIISFTMQTLRSWGRMWTDYMND